MLVRFEPDQAGPCTHLDAIKPAPAPLPATPPLARASAGASRAPRLLGWAAGHRTLARRYANTAQCPRHTEPGERRRRLLLLNRAAKVANGGRAKDAPNWL